MNNTQRPEARKSGLVIQDLPEEILVYDLKTNKAHCLNQTAAVVWKLCDGNNSVTEISQLYSRQAGNQINEDLIWLAIDQLNENKLLVTEVNSEFHGESRRSVIKKIGMAAVIALPVVASLAAPTSVLAIASCAGCTGTGPNAQCQAANCPPNCAGGTCVAAVAGRITITKPKD